MDYDFEDETNDEPNEHRGELTEEAAYICDACGEEIVVPLDASAGTQQHYVEDCPVCCRPNQIFVEYDPEGNANVWSRPE